MLKNHQLILFIMDWSPDRPINELSENIRRFYIENAKFLYNDLKSNRLEVILIPAPKPMHRSHMIRAVQNQNPEWYRDLYWSIPHFRRDRSLRALDRIRKQEDRLFRVLPFKYDSIYRELIHNRLIEGFRENGYVTPPNNEVRKYFGFRTNFYRTIRPEEIEYINYLDCVPF